VALLDAGLDPDVVIRYLRGVAPELLDRFAELVPASSDDRAFRRRRRTAKPSFSRRIGISCLNPDTPLVFPPGHFVFTDEPVVIAKLGFLS